MQNSKLVLRSKTICVALFKKNLCLQGEFIAEISGTSIEVQPGILCDSSEFLL